ncbi:hypothetical protein LXL04_011228 [Taraxacum kok-saghyz]
MEVINTPQELANLEYDDAFYAELERRVLTLIDDHDHNELSTHTHKYSNSSLFTTKRRYDTIKQTSNYFYWNENGGDLVPASILNLWERNSKGTGVFIPRVVNSRSRNKPRRKNYNKGIANKDVTGC